jgi:hypothetical protein
MAAGTYSIVHPLCTQYVLRLVQRRTRWTDSAVAALLAHMYTMHVAVSALRDLAHLQMHAPCVFYCGVKGPGGHTRGGAAGAYQRHTASVSNACGSVVASAASKCACYIPG